MGEMGGAKLELGLERPPFSRVAKQNHPTRQAEVARDLFALDTRGDGIEGGLHLAEDALGEASPRRRRSAPNERSSVRPTNPPLREEAPLPILSRSNTITDRPPRASSIAALIPV